MAKYLGIDFGSKRVGIALSDDGGSMAFPKDVLANDEALLEKVNSIVGDQLVEKIVIGESQNYQMQDNKIMHSARKFAEELAKISGKEVIFHPEFLSSVQAGHLQDKNAKIDASAAAIILQSYLDIQQNGNKN